MKYSEMEISMMQAMQRMKAIHFWEVCTQMPKGEAILIHTICHHENGKEPMAVSELTEQTRMHAAAVSRLMRSLEEKGLIVRSIDPKNHRNILVQATEDGSRLNQENTNRIHRYWLTVLGRIPKEDQEIMLRIWSEVMDNMEAVLEQQRMTENE